MFARSLAAVAVTGLALAVPVAAVAAEYPADTASITCSTEYVAPSGTFTCTVTAEGGTDAQLTATTSGDDVSIAGTVTSATKSIASGSASFTVTAPATEGEIAIGAIVDGVAVDGDTVTVLVTTDEELLSGTGFDSMPLAVGAGALLVAGAAVVFVTARRRAGANA